LDQVRFHHRLRGLLRIILLNRKVSQMEGHALDEACGVVGGYNALVTHSVLLAVEIDTALGHGRVESYVSWVQSDLECNRGCQVCDLDVFDVDCGVGESCRMLERKTHSSTYEGDPWRRLERRVLEDDEIHLASSSAADINVRHRHADRVSWVGRVLHRVSLSLG